MTLAVHVVQGAEVHPKPRHKDVRCKSFRRQIYHEKVPNDGSYGEGVRLAQGYWAYQHTRGSPFAAPTAPALAVAPPPLASAAQPPLHAAHGDAIGESVSDNIASMSCTRSV